MEVGELRFAWPEVRTVATDLLASLHALRRDKPGVRLMAALTGATASTIIRRKCRPSQRLRSGSGLNHRECGRASQFVARRRMFLLLRARLAAVCHTAARYPYEIRSPTGGAVSAPPLASS